jgi:threonine aldolase
MYLDIIFYVTKGYVQNVVSALKPYGIPVHIDGARLWNAAVASNASVSSLVDGASSVNVCLSKGPYLLY